MFRPNAEKFDTVIRVQHRSTVNVNGEDEISYTSESDVQFCKWKGMGGTETTEAGNLVVLDTAILTMWYSSTLTERDRILLNDDSGLAYEVINIEDVEMRHLYSLVKVKLVISA